MVSVHACGEITSTEIRLSPHSVKRSMWQETFMDDYTAKYTVILTHAHTVCTRPFSPRENKKKGPGYEATLHYASTRGAV